MDDNDPNKTEKDNQLQSSSDSLSSSGGSSQSTESTWTPRMTIAEKEKLMRKEEARLRKLKQQQRNEEEMLKEKERQAKTAQEYEQKRQEDLKKKQEIKEKEDNIDFYEKEKREREDQLSRLTEGKPVNMSDDTELKGLDAEIAKKLQAKYDVNYEYRACQWVEKMTEEAVFDIGESLKSGTILCKLLNAIKPNIIPKYNTRPVALMQRENIKLYLEGCEKLGLSKGDLFIISDLHEKKNIPAVVQNIYALARWVHSQPNYTGPVLEGAGVIANTAPVPRHNKERKPLPDFSEPKPKSSSVNSTYQSSAPEFKKEAKKENVNTESKPSTPSTPKLSVNVQELQKEVLALRAQVDNLKEELGKREHAFDPITGTNNDVISHHKDVMLVEDIMTLLCDKLELDAKEVQKDFQVFHKHRIKTGKHLWMLIKNQKRWNEFRLPALEKCCLEEMMLGYTVTPKPPPSKYSTVIRAAVWIAAIVGICAIAYSFSYTHPDFHIKNLDFKNLAGNLKYPGRQ